MQGLLLFLILVSPVLLPAYYWGENTDMELSERSDEFVSCSVHVPNTRKSPAIWITGCQSLGSEEAQTVQAQGSAERCFLCSCLRADTSCLLGFHRTAGLQLRMWSEPLTQIFLTFVFLLLNGEFGQMVLEIDPF